MSQRIYDLEMKLLSTEIRKSPHELSQLFSDDFVEFGSSGKVYNKPEVVHALQHEPETKFEVVDFKINPLSPEVVLATYRVKKIRVEENKTTQSLRSSIWKLSDIGWQLVFHQGTRIE